MRCRDRSGLNVVKVSLADVRVEREVKFDGFYEVAGLATVSTGRESAAISGCDRDGFCTQLKAVRQDSVLKSVSRR